MRTEQLTYTTLIADEGKILRRKSDGWEAGEQVTLGYNYYEAGIGLAKAKLETPDDYEEIDKPKDYQEGEIIDQAARLLNAIKVQETINKRMQEETANINNYDISDEDALKLKDIYPEWEIGLDVKVNEKYRLGDDLWKVLQAHTTQENYKPSLSTSSLWVRINETNKGTIDDPIPYTPPMEIFNGKYYIQNDITYKCTRDSGIALSHDLSALVGIYVEKV